MQVDDNNLNINLTSSRIAWVDISKGVAILLVILGHTLTSGGSAWKAVFSFHMPLFFILAGYTFKDKTWRNLLTSSAKRLLLPYFLMFILLAIRSNAGLFLVPNRLMSSLIYALAYQPKQLPWTVDIPYVGAIWFLLCMFVSRVYLNAIIRFFKRNSVPKIAQLFIVFLIGYVGVYIGRHILVPFTLDISMVGMLFMYLGWLMRNSNFQSRIANWRCVVISAIVWGLSFNLSALEMGARDYSSFPIALICACAGSCCCISLSLFLDDVNLSSKSLISCVKRFLSSTGRDSMAVFCIHCLEYGIIDWRALPFLIGLPACGLLAGVVRIIFALLVLLLMHLV